MAAPRKYPDELRERAIRLVLDSRAEGSVTGECTRIGRQLGINPETLLGWVQRAEIDAGQRPGTTSSDAERIAALERAEHGPSDLDKRPRKAPFPGHLAVAR